MADTPPFKSLSDLFAADQRGELSVSEFDDELWYFMTEKNGPFEHPDRFPEPVRFYVASRLIEWEVGNGGFAQAAYNCPEWLDMAAQGYEVLGLPLAAERIRKAKGLIDSGSAAFSEESKATIETVFSEFAESALAELDESLDEIDWWATERRIEYVRANRGAFVAAV